MSLRKLPGKLLIFAVLELGSLGRVPMSPDSIEKVMQVMLGRRSSTCEEDDL